MSLTLILAMTTILMAAALYTVAVFAERKSGVLKPWHVVLFWAGFVFDTTGTTLMSQIAGGWQPDLHGIVGVIAIVLMLVHAVWATIAIALKQEKVLHNFHRFSLAVWSLWMVALVTGFGLVAVKELGLGVPGA